jgi:GT2 family glycosyltransferase/glycosyltransferase involved in cell wall biosynthesis
LKLKIKIAFLSATPELNRKLVEQTRALYPDLPLWVVSDFPPEDPNLSWIRYRANRGFAYNLACCRHAVRGHSVRLATVMLVPNVPFRRMRLVALALSPRGFLAFNENLNHFMLRPRQLPAIARHAAWRLANAARWLVRWSRKADWREPRAYALARAAGWLRPRGNRRAYAAIEPRDPGITVVIPSRTGRSLLEQQLPSILAGRPNQIIVVDNGSTDDTAVWLAREYPSVVVEHSAEPLSFARAVNLGIARARYSHVCLLNNDMLIEPGFFGALRHAFHHVPDLFCATAQIRFPQGVRREETGKTVHAHSTPEDFPVRCDEPLPGEDGTWVLYGSGGCSLYDAAKLVELGNLDESYAPAYVEDLDLGFRAWQRGWPSVYVAGAVVEHRHRATTSRYFTTEELDRVLEVNYLRFVARAVSNPRIFRRLWKQALARIAGPALAQAAGIALEGGPAGRAEYSEARILALAGGAVSVFPGRASTGKPRVVVASPYLPFPLSHGGAVRMYNLMRRAAAEFDQVLVAFTERHEPPPPELLAICAEVVLVERAGSHALPFRGRPEVVEEFDSPAFGAALEQTVRKWRAEIVQLEFTQLAQYAGECAGARTILVEHDVTFDLYQQLSRLEDHRDLREQAGLWRRFETDAWTRVDRVVVMSERDRALAGKQAVVLPNGVDLDRFRARGGVAEPRRLLFIGSFAHLPNRLAVGFFLNQVFPLLHDISLHIVAGARHEQFRVDTDLARPGVELEGFVSDVRPAYERAALVIAPLVASAGTNIKILEAMAMGKCVVSTPAGVNGLDLRPGADFVLVHTAAEMAAEIECLLADSAARSAIEAAARARVERDFGWDAIARAQSRLYRL